MDDAPNLSLPGISLPQHRAMLRTLGADAFRRSCRAGVLLHFGSAHDAMQGDIDLAQTAETTALAFSLLPVDGAVRLGRSADNTVVVPSRTVSSQHAVIESNAAGGWDVVDLGSRNGTFVDDHRVWPGRACGLVDGVTLRLGSFHTTYMTAAMYLVFLQDYRTTP